MNCEEFEPLLADALGNELSEENRPAFETHLARCDLCRREYESLCTATDRLRSLPGARRMTLSGEGDRVLPDPAAARPAQRSRWLSGGAFRYAAGVMIAFFAGYAFHAGLVIGVSSPAANVVVQGRAGTPAGRPGNSLQRALLSAHEKNPSRSDLAKCLIAMFPASR